MTETRYRDLRQGLWRDLFESARPYHNYLLDSPEKYRRKWEAMKTQVSLLPEHRDRIAAFSRRVLALCHSGVWCGDCVRQGPMFHAISEASDRIDLRFIERVDDSEITNELRICGAMRVPVVVFLSEDFYEVGRVGDRMLVAYRRKARTELGDACDAGLLPPPDEELQEELLEWVDVFERMHWIVRLSPPLRQRHGD